MTYDHPNYVATWFLEPCHCRPGNLFAFLTLLLRSYFPNILPLSKSSDEPIP